MLAIKTTQMDYRPHQKIEEEEMRSRSGRAREKTKKRNRPINCKQPYNDL